MVRYELKPTIGTRVMNQNGVRHGIELLEIRLIINILFQV